MTTSAAAAVGYSDMALLWMEIFKLDLPCKHRREGEISTVMLLNTVVNNGRMYTVHIQYIRTYKVLLQ